MYFQYNGSTYEQTESTTIGSSVPAVIVSPYMKSFKDHAVTSPYKPKIWKRYVAETFTILAFDSVESFLKHLPTNSLPLALPWRRKATTNSPSSIPQLQKKLFEAQAPVYTGSQNTLTNT